MINKLLAFTNFFFQAVDGIRDYKVTGVQTCALPIFPDAVARGGRRDDLECDDRQAEEDRLAARHVRRGLLHALAEEIGRASCRERERIPEGVGLRNKKKKNVVRTKNDLQLIKVNMLI